MSDTSTAAAPSGSESTESAPNTPSSEQTTSQPQVSQEKAAPAQEPIYEIKVDGTTLRMTLDEMKKHAQLGTAATKRFQEAAQTKKQAEQILAKLKQNPIEAAREAGVSEAAFRELVEKYLYDQIKRDEMTPEQRELEELRTLKAQSEKEKLTRKEEEDKQKQDQEVIHYQNQYIASYEKAFASAGLQKSEMAVQRIAQIQLEALENNWDMPVEMAVDQYKKEQSSNIKGYLGALTVDQLEEVLGKDKLKELRKKDLAGLKNPTSTQTTLSKARPNTNQTQKTTASKFFETLR